MHSYPIQGEPTTFQEVYDRFLGKITDDMYVEWTEQDTNADLKNILIDAIPGFEFPRVSLNFNLELEQFINRLTSEEINILALLMYNAWLQRQVASIEQIRMKYSGTDFKMTSQANHLSKLIELKKEAERQTHHMQRLYKRRKLIDEDGLIQSNWSVLSENRVLDG